MDWLKKKCLDNSYSSKKHTQHVSADIGIVINLFYDYIFSAKIILSLLWVTYQYYSGYFFLFFLKMDFSLNTLATNRIIQALLKLVNGTKSLGSSPVCSNHDPMSLKGCGGESRVRSAQLQFTSFNFELFELIWCWREY